MRFAPQSLLLLAVAGCGGPSGGGDAGPMPCTIAVPDGASEPTSTNVLPGGQRLAPSGTQVPLGGFPLGFALIPGGARLVVGDAGYTKEYLRVVDTASGKVLSETEVPSHFLGLAVTSDGRKLYASSPLEQVVRVFAIDAAGALAPVDQFRVAGYPAGLALSADGQTLLVGDQVNNLLAVLDATSGVVLRSIALGACSDLGCPHPYAVLAARSGSEAYVSLWGGAGVAVIDSTQMAPLAVLLTGKNPAGMALSSDGTRLYVANSDDDTISAIDPIGRSVVLTSPIDAGGLLPGLSPSDLALSPDGSRLWVAAAGVNALYALAPPGLKAIGALPTGWYPASVAALPSGRLAVANAKGTGIGPNDSGAYIPTLMHGTLSLIDAPSDAELAAGALAVAANSARPGTREATVTCSDPSARFPVPLDEKARSPIEHVILLVRENKTYDAELGDLAGANGDPKLVLFPERDTPNLHALARQFTNLDNFYSDAEASIQGHAWTTAATCNDFLEKAWFTLPGYRNDLRSQLDLARGGARPSYGSIFEALDADGVDFVVWGEAFAFRTALGAHFDGYFPGGPLFNLEVTDVDKAAYVAGRIRDDHFLPPFSYLLLPRNHTYATLPGKPTPEVMVADNDVATGQVIDALSRSSFWPKTVVFLIEDDPQDGGDHIEAHRSTCLVIGPHARHATVVSTHYDVTSIYRTIERILRVPPMNRADAAAPAMMDVFSERPDPTPYDARPSTVPMNGVNSADAPGAAESQAMDFSGPDRARGLGQVLWRAIKGSDPPWKPAIEDDE